MRHEIENESRTLGSTITSNRTQNLYLIMAWKISEFIIETKFFIFELKKIFFDIFQTTDLSSNLIGKLPNPIWYFIIIR